MTEYSDTPAQAGLHDLMSGAAEDFLPGTAPYDAIIGDARRRGRVRVVGGSALSLVAIGAAVAVGTSSFGGSAGHASAQNAVAPGGAVVAGGAVAAVPPPAAVTKSAPVNNDHYGKTVIAQGDFDGTHWTLTRDLNLQNVINPAPPSAGKGAKGPKGPWAFDDVYVTGPNGLRDRAAGGGSTAPGQLSAILTHFSGPNTDPAASVALTQLGVGALNDSLNKEKPSPYGIEFLSGIVSSKVARVQVVFDNGASQDATLVAAPAGEDGQYYYLPFASASHAGGHIVYHDSHGHILPSRISQF